MRSAGLACVLSLLAASPVLAADPALTPDGWGDLRIGMTEAEAVQRFELQIPNDDDVSSVACRELSFAAGGPDLSVMTEDGVVTRLSLYREGPLRTDKGFGVGSREADIRRAYGPALRIDTHLYVDEPAHYLTAWTTPGQRGVRYETDTDGVVTTVHVGKSITYVEGCL